jgi:hypothetical protein
MQSMSQTVLLSLILTISKEWQTLLSKSYLKLQPHNQINSNQRNTTFHRSFSLEEETTML